MLKWLVALTVISLAQLGGAAPAQPSAAPNAIRPVSFVKIESRIEPGQAIQHFQTSLGCWAPMPPNLALPKITPDPRRYAELFSREVKGAGFVSAQDPDNPFQTDEDTSDLQVAAEILDLQRTVCIAGVGLLRPALDARDSLDQISGTAILKVDWQIYSRSLKKVVFRKIVTSTGTLTDHAPGNSVRLTQTAFRTNVIELVNSEAFRQLVSTPQTADTFLARTNPAIVLSGSLAARPRKMSDALGAVVVIENSAGHGSGFLVSSDGFF